MYTQFLSVLTRIRPSNHANGNGGGNGNGNNVTQPVGAFHGSGFATAVTAGDTGQLMLFFQHSSGELRRLVRSNDNTWTGGDARSSITNDAKNSTPISVVTYHIDANPPAWHLFYIDRQNIVREKISNDLASTWRDGTIGDSNLLAMDDPNVSLQASYGQFWLTPQQTVPTIGIHLIYAPDAQTQRLMQWNVEQNTWTKDEDYTANGHAGVAFYSWKPGSYWYGMFLNFKNEVVIAYKDATGKDNGGKWTDTKLSLSGAMSNTSMGYTDYFFMQLDSGRLQGYNISFNDSDVALSPQGGQVSIPELPIPGAHFSVTKIPDGDLAVIAQDNATDVSLNIMDGGLNVWSHNELPIPDN
jgi:hypothetical protein